MKAQIFPYLIQVGFLGIFTISSVIFSSVAHAQGDLRVAVEAKLQIFVDPGINVTANAGNAPVTHQNFTGGGYRTSESGYNNNVSGGGITTGVITGLFTANNSESSAAYNLLFNPSVTLTNNTANPLNYSFIYNISYGAYVDAKPNGGTASASTNVNIFLNNSVTGAVNFFSDSLSTTSEYKQSDPSKASTQLTGSLVLFPNQSTTYAFLTSVEGSTQYTPAPAITVPEPASLIVLATCLPLVALMRHRRRRAADTFTKSPDVG